MNNGFLSACEIHQPSRRPFSASTGPTFSDEFDDVSQLTCCIDMDYSRTSALPFSLASSTAAGWATVVETLWMIPSMPFGNPSPASEGEALAQRARIMTELSRTQSKPVDDLSSVIIFCGVVHTTTQLLSNRLGRANSFRRPFSLECEADFCPGNRFFLSPVHCCWQQHPWCFLAFPARMTPEGNTAFPLPTITAHNIRHESDHQWSLLLYCKLI